MAKPIGTLGVIDSITVGGRAFTDLANLVVLASKNNTHQYYSFYEANGTGPYQVPTGKVLQIRAAQFTGLGTPDGLS